MMKEHAALEVTACSIHGMSFGIFGAKSSKAVSFSMAEV